MKKVKLSFNKSGHLVVLKTSDLFERLRGLLGRELGKEGVYGLWIEPCNSVHTVAMKYPLDLIYLNKDQKIIKLVENVDAWKFSAALLAHSVIEIQAGLIEEFALRVGDTVKSNSI